jgi:ParB-like chromosome segregation protein Spo0J
VPTSSLIRTHAQTLSRQELQELTSNIAANGIRQPIEYVETSGGRYIVNGNHRTIAARTLGIQEVPAVERRLPYAGFRTEADLVGYSLGGEGFGAGGSFGGGGW